MNKVLIIGNFWPYRYGSRRAVALARYLPEFNWQPIMLTAPLFEKPGPEFTVIETPYRDTLSFWKKAIGINREDPSGDLRSRVKERFGMTSKNSFMDFLLTRCGEIVNYPDSEKGWAPFATTAATKLLEQETIGAVISLWPVTSNLVARRLKTKFQIPWVADFCDLWSQNHGYPYSPLRKFIDKRLELKTLSSADVLVTISHPWAEKLRKLHKGKTIGMITSGFDPAEVNAPPAKLTAKFTITYTGTIHTNWQHPSKLFAALHSLISNGALDANDIEVRFYGINEDWLDKEIKQYELSHIVKQYGIVPKETALAKQRESQLLLLLDWDDPVERGVHTGKIFEYLGTRRPILTTGGAEDGVVAQLLSETKAGVHATTVEDIENKLKELYAEYKAKGAIAYRGDEAAVNQYNLREMARKYADVLNKAVLKSKNHGVHDSEFA